MLGMSQESLGESVGVTFQQIQKYEKGLNRIGASRLYEFSRVLEIPVGFFYEGLGASDVGADASPRVVGFGEQDASFDHGSGDNITNKELLALVRAFNDIPDPAVRKGFITLLRTMSGKTTAAPSLRSGALTPENVD
jgi:transcriptional regulator with XRE-family HTH domain